MGKGNAVVRLILWLCLAVSTAVCANELDLGPRLVQEEVRLPAPGGYTIAASFVRPAWSPNAGPGPIASTGSEPAARPSFGPGSKRSGTRDWPA